MKKKKPIFIKEHVLKPEHKKLSKKDKKKILEKYNIPITQLPAIKRTDAALLDMDVEKGDIIMITRNSPTAGKYIFYRRVV